MEKKKQFTKGNIKEILGIELIDIPHFKNGINDLLKVLGDTVMIFNYTQNEYKDNETGEITTTYKAELIAPSISNQFAGVKSILVYFDNKELWTAMSEKFNGTLINLKDLYILDYKLDKVIQSFTNQSTNKSTSYGVYSVKSITLSYKKES